MKRSAVFFDRDGVLNRYVYNSELGTVDSPAHPGEFELLPGAAEAVASLNSMGLPAVVVSNQPGIAKGKISSRTLDAINESMREQFAASGARLDAVYYCRHHPEAVFEEFRRDCDCRKPKPGLLLRAASERSLDLSRSFFIGDDVPDVLAGRAAGVITILLSPRRCAVCDEFRVRAAYPHHVVTSLPQAVALIRDLLAGRREAPEIEPAVEPCILEGPEASYTSQYLRESAEIISRLDAAQIDHVGQLLRAVRERGGRLFLLGVGGGAGHASHAACDFRKIAQIESYCVSDNVSELTARVNDDGWDSSYRNWLAGSRLRPEDLVFVFSVGGGDLEKNISSNLVRALQFARETGCSIAGVVGRDGGYTARVADACVVVPVVNAASVTPHTESFQALVWHLLVSHPAVKAAEMKWESQPLAAAPSGGPAPLLEKSTAASR